MTTKVTDLASKPTSVDEILEPLKRGAGIAQRNEAATKINRLIVQARLSQLKEVDDGNNTYIQDLINELNKELGDSNDHHLV